MTQAEIKQLIQKQRTFFHSGATLDVEYRIHTLQKMKLILQSVQIWGNVLLKATCARLVSS